MTFSENIVRLRKKADLRQKKLAEKIGVSYGAVGNWESGNNTPKFSQILIICEALYCTPNDLLLGENEGNGYLVMEDGAKYGLTELDRLRKDKAELDEKFKNLLEKHIEALEMIKLGK